MPARQNAASSQIIAMKKDFITAPQSSRTGQIVPTVPANETCKIHFRDSTNLATTRVSSQLSRLSRLSRQKTIGKDLCSCPTSLSGGSFQRNNIIRSICGDAVKMVGKALQRGFPLIEIVVVVVSGLNTFQGMIEDALGNFR